MHKSAKHILGICLKHIADDPLHLSPNAPLWFNPCLKEFFHLEDGYRWSKFGLTYLHQLYDKGELKTFAQLKRDLEIPDSWAFQFTRLNHVAHTQFGTEPISLENSSLEKLLATPEHAKLISSYYSVLLGKELPKEKKIREKWTNIIPELTEEQWGEVLTSYTPKVISARDKMIQLRYLHQMYYTPLRLCKMGRRDGPTCH